MKLKNVRVHNLKSVSVDLPSKKLICFTGVSGSGKSSLAFDTIYVEGQRRYVESLSQHARRFIGELTKPDVDNISDITPTISIEQKTAGRNPRSTVGTMTELYDFLRVIYARLGEAHCPVSGEPVQARSKEEIIREIQQRRGKCIIMAPMLRGKKGELKDDLEAVQKKGFTRIRIDGEVVALSDDISLDKSHSHDLDIVVDRIDIKPDQLSRVAESVTTALELGGGSCIIFDHETKEEQLYSTRAYSPKSGLSYEPLDPMDFSFNSPHGMCPECQGMGLKHEYIFEKIFDPEKSIAENCCLIASPYETVRYGNIYDNLASMHDFDVHTKWKDLSEEAKDVFLHGTKRKWTRMVFRHPVTGAIWHDLVAWRGVLFEAYDKYAKATSENYKRKQEELMRWGICPGCKGARIKAYPAATLFRKNKIFDMTEMPVEELLAFFQGVKLNPTEALLGKDLIAEVISRLEFLKNVGLEYLQLSRSAPTLSGGEAQRVRLASQIGSGLVGITYILDEPSIGLHPRDNKKLVQSLEQLRDKNNTVIVVEHDEETIRAADHIVDFGPKAGLQGGEIMYEGDLSGLLKEKRSITGSFLSGREKIWPRAERRKAKGENLLLSGATHHNLKKVDVKIPLGCFVAITGVSGSGKSSLFLETLYPALANKLMKAELRTGAFEKLDEAGLDKVIEIDQSPIGRTPRSNPATYVGVFDEIRTLFAKLPESEARGYKSGRFSFNVKEGSCPECSGIGQVKIDMDFLEESWVECPLCHGLRFDEETLQVRFKEKNIRDVLEMSIEEALHHFSEIPSIAAKLKTLTQVGLDYLKLGQSSTTLSGGEAQRMKLAKELSRPATGKTLYLLDEPTTGLHFYNLNHLLHVLHALVDRGNTVVVIEHNMDLVRTADWIIDMGPGSGSKGGQIIATGSPEEIAQKKSPTGEALHLAMYPPKMKVKKRRETAIDAGALIARGCNQNNLKNIDVTIPHNQLTVITGPSGAGKSSLAFETIYAEGQRRYVDSLSPYVRQFVKSLPKPKLDSIEGLCPTVAIEQRLSAANPRSTVGTMTEVYDYLRLLYSRIGIPHCPKTGFEIRAISKEHVVDRILQLENGEKLHIMAPIEIRRTDSFQDVLTRLQKQGFIRVRLNKKFYELGSEIPYDPKRKNELLLVVDRLKVDPSMKILLLEAVSTASKMGKGKLIIMHGDTDKEKDRFFNLAFAVEETGESYPEITPQTFAFNTHEGMCPECQGLGFTWGFDLSSVPLGQKTPNQIMETLLGEIPSYLKSYLRTKPSKTEFFAGSAELVETEYEGRPFRVSFKGVNPGITEALKHHSEDEPLLPEEWMEKLKENHCLSCDGTRINSLARGVTIGKKSIADFSRMPLDEELQFLKSLKVDYKEDLTLKQVYDELLSRLHFLNQIGLGYLSLERSAPTLSGGEAQRVRLARQIGSGLTGVLYVLDEPTTGLHPEDCQTLMSSLTDLKKKGNTLLVVEHDAQVIAAADQVIELGPRSGKHGGQVVKNKIKKAKPATFSINTRPGKGALHVEKSSCHNLKKISCKIPLQTLTCLTGVSGSGKSTLLFDVILKDLRTLKGSENISDTIVVDQKPMGQTLRSDVATYMDILTYLRAFFAELPEAKAKGLEPKFFSRFHRKGMCSTCWGLGYKKVEMHFLPAVKIACPACQGFCLNPVSLTVRYQEKNLGEMLKMTIDELTPLFISFPRITRLFNMLSSVGLGYLALGQEVQTLSGGEQQRLKLAYYLSKRARPQSLYLLDEPTQGLSEHETDSVMSLLQGLVDKGHTVIAIEHNMSLIRKADYVVDLGPGAGVHGGQIVATGTPAEIAKSAKSVTGKYLR